MIYALAVGLAGESLPLRTDDSVKAHLGGPLPFVLQIPSSPRSGQGGRPKLRPSVPTWVTVS